MNKLMLAAAALLMSTGVAFAADDAMAAGNAMKKMTADECKTAMEACKDEACKEELAKNNGCAMAAAVTKAP